MLLFRSHKKRHKFDYKSKETSQSKCVSWNAKQKKIDDIVTKPKKRQKYRRFHRERNKTGKITTEKSLVSLKRKYLNRCLHETKQKREFEEDQILLAEEFLEKSSVSKHKRSSSKTLAAANVKENDSRQKVIEHFEQLNPRKT